MTMRASCVCVAGSLAVAGLVGAAEVSVHAQGADDVMEGPMSRDSGQPQNPRLNERLNTILQAGCRRLSARHDFRQTITKRHQEREMQTR
jgi:hypothetical protein